ncbi:MAG: hypothetical protein AB7E74_06415 [Pirellulales bacterium]
MLHQEHGFEAASGSGFGATAGLPSSKKCEPALLDVLTAAPSVVSSSDLQPRLRTARTASLLCCLWLSLLGVARADDQPIADDDIPAVLQPWKAWVTWPDHEVPCPRPFNAADQRICFWPSQLSLVVEQGKANWTIDVNVFDDTWVPLPGSAETWPQNVRVDGQPIAVLPRDGKPFVRLPAGKQQLAGEFQWNEMPQRIAIPQQVGILSLTVDGQAIEQPNWDASGDVWLKRQRAEAEQKDLLAARVYRVIEDGVPIWLRTRIELAVSGKSREESLGWILPEGWELSYVESPIPVAVDQQGRVKAQVRAGKWTIAIDAFRTTDLEEFRYPPDAEPIAPVELIGWRARPKLRSAELTGIQAVDVTQTTFPDDWRALPVYEWPTDTSFKLVEKLRGMGDLHPPGLTIERRFWLDDDGDGLTYRDSLSGPMQQIWRLDVADGVELGAVRIDGQGQLVTINPQTGAHGVEIRNRNLQMDAIGRIGQTQQWLATGWNTPADSLQLTMNLPPGWRVLAVLGADQVDGDWLTAWTLLDLFVLLIFSMALVRLLGWSAGLLALLALGLAYHEPGAPRYTWLFLLLPVALLRVMPAGVGRRIVAAWKYAALLLLALLLVPFLAQQVQTAIYPQLERPGTPYSRWFVFPALHADVRTELSQVGGATEDFLASSMGGQEAPAANERGRVAAVKENLKYDATAKIQTGPAEPDWTWNQVSCRWNGPVGADQQIRPILISLFWHRVLTVARVVLLLALVATLLRGGRGDGSKPGGSRGWIGWFSRRGSATAAGALVAICLLVPATCRAQEATPPVAPIPDAQLLDTLRQRLQATSDAFPHAAEIATTKLQVREGRITIESEVHAAVEVAVPLPGRLPTWSPVSVQLDGETNNVAVCRRDGYLWAIVPSGVHRVVVEGLLAESSEWEWTFLLQPRHVTIDAPDWNVTGVGNNGVPEKQVFFARKQQADDSQAAYDRKDFHAVVAVERQLEVGLVWRVHNTVTRLSSPGKAISLKLPLLEGESVLTANLDEQAGQIEVRLAAGETSFEWDSELSAAAQIRLVAQNNEQWVERWQLIASPVWDVALAGLPPVFDAEQPLLIPTWQPWPGEEVTLAFKQPLAVAGETVTVQNVYHETSLGDRQRTGRLQLSLECSLGSDFAIALNPKAEITSLKLDGRELPVRRDGEHLIVSVHPGKQVVEAAWREADVLDTVAQADAIELPVDGANINTTIYVPENRWVLWAEGPQRGPAVRFWVVLAVALLAALVLGSVSLSPLGRIEWVLLAIGLTQVNVAAAIVVVVWLFLLAWRGSRSPDDLPTVGFNLLQMALVLLTVASLVIFVVVASKGLLGQPEMFIVGNYSTRTNLQWFQPRSGESLPQPYVVSISVWFYRYAMLAWALWLTAALLKWLARGWRHFTHDGAWKHAPEPAKVSPPPLATPDK